MEALPPKLHMPKWSNLPLLAIVGAYFVLVMLYSLATPLLEAPDAYFHFAMIEYVARNGELPPKDDAQNQPWRQMTFHAPLYYLTGAALIAPINTDDFYTYYVLNPHAQIGEPHAQDNQNFVAHAGDKWRKAGLAIRIVRFYSMILGAITLVSVYGIVRYTFPNKSKLALLAPLILAFNPQFLFMHGVVSNDTLVTALTTLGLVLIIRSIRLGVTWQRVVVIAVVLALNSIAKVSGITLYPAAALIMGWATWREHHAFRLVLLFGIIGLVIWTAIAGWWYWDNYQRFDDPFAARHVAESTGLRSGDIDYSNEMRGLYYSFWGLFGWFNIIAPSIFYDWVTWFIILSGIGLLLAIRRVKWITPNWMIWSLLGGHTTIFLIAWHQFMAWVTAGQGRLWFPLLGVIALLLGIGLAEFPSWIRGIVLGGMATATVAFPFLLIQPRFQPAHQTPADEWSVPSDAAEFWLREPWKDIACLQLWVRPAVINSTSDSLEVAIAWQALCPIEGFWSRFIHLSDLSVETCVAGDTQHILAQYDTMPDGGNLPLPAFKVGYVLEETIRVDIPPNVPIERISHLQLGLYDANGTFIRMIIEDAASTDSIEVTHCGGPDAVNIRLP